MSKKDIVFCKGGGCTAKLGPGGIKQGFRENTKKI